MKLGTMFKGDAAYANGNSKELHGATFYEYVLAEGHRKGEIILSTDKPRSGIVTWEEHVKLVEGK